MIKSVVLKNFRGFRDHTVDFTPFCLLIGQNNAGKTTLIEALRIVSAALKRVPSARFEMAPSDFAPEMTGPVFKFSVETLDIEHRGIHYNYDSSEPAVIRVRYNNNCSIVVAVSSGLDQLYCQLIRPAGKKVSSRADASASRFRPIFVMPPVGSLLPEETQRDKKYLYKHIDGYLSYRHIRNQMADRPLEFERFKDFLTTTWGSPLQVGEIEYGLGDKQNHYGLTIRDGPFVSEMALVGSGLQAWIQTVWFLARVDTDSIVVLDEPDVYLHADLQRKLVKLLSAEKYRQTIVATHSMEMIADVSPTEIVAVTKRSPRSRPLSSNAQAQGMADALGTNLNIQLSKLASAGLVVFLEGKDYGFLDQIAFKKGNQFYDRFSRVPHFSVGGMNNWPRAAMAAKAFHDTSAGAVRSIMFVDRDYKPSSLFTEITEEAAKSFLTVNVWRRKEIENYFLDDHLICSYIANRAKQDVNQEQVSGIISSVINRMATELPELIADGYQTQNRKLALPTAMGLAKDYLAACEREGRLVKDIVCGKRAISLISAETQAKWGVSVAPMSLCRHIKLADVPRELVEAIEALA